MYSHLWKFCIFFCMVKICYSGIYPPQAVPCCNAQCCCSNCDRNFCNLNPVGQQDGDYIWTSQCICNAEFNCTTLPTIGNGVPVQPPQPGQAYIGIPLPPSPVPSYPGDQGFIPAYPYSGYYPQESGYDSKYPDWPDAYVDRPYGIRAKPAKTKFQVLYNEVLGSDAQTLQKDCSCDSPQNTCISHDPCNNNQGWNYNYFPEKWQPKKLFTTTWGIILFVTAIILGILILILLVSLIFSCIRSRKSYYIEA